MDKVDILIIGGCAAGMSCAAAARRENEKIKITVLEKGKYISYGSCAIPYYIEGKIEDWKPLVHHTPEEFKKERNINVLIHAEAAKIDTDKKIVYYSHEGEKKQINYEKLLISTGGWPFDPFKVEGKYENLFVCRNVEHAQAIRKFSDKKEVKKAIVLGSGYIGLELACAFKEKGIDVEVFERESHILNGFLPEIYKEAFEYLIAKGLKINLNESVEDFESEGKKVKKVITDKGEYEADLIILAIGARPATKFLEDTGIELGKYGEVLIDKTMKTNIKDVWAAGDCACTYNAFTGERIYFPLAQTANRQGKIAGVNMAAGKNLELSGVVKSQAMKLFDIEIGSVGLSFSEAEELGYDLQTAAIKSFTKAYRQLGGGKIRVTVLFDKKTRLILGAQMIGSEGTALRTNNFAIAIYNKMTVDEYWNVDLVYVPPVAPVYDSTLIAARSAMNKLNM